MMLTRRLFMRTPRCSLLIVLLLLATGAACASLAQPRHLSANSAASFTVEQIKSYPFPNELTTCAQGERIAWAFNERGARNVWVADGPDFKARRLTNYQMDDGQELSSLAISRAGNYVIYVRGAYRGSNWESSPGRNPAMAPARTPVQIFSVPFAGGEPKLLSE